MLFARAYAACFSFPCLLSHVRAHVDGMCRGFKIVFPVVVARLNPFSRIKRSIVMNYSHLNSIWEIEFRVCFDTIKLAAERGIAI